MQKLVACSRAFAARPPREVVIGIARDVQGKYNPITLCNHVVVFGKVVAAHVADPPVLRLYAIGPGYRMGSLSGGTVRTQD